MSFPFSGLDVKRVERSIKTSVETISSETLRTVGQTEDRTVIYAVLTVARIRFLSFLIESLDSSKFNQTNLVRSPSPLLAYSFL